MRMDLRALSMPDIAMVLEIAYKAINQMPEWVGENLDISDEVVGDLGRTLDKYLNP